MSNSIDMMAIPDIVAAIGRAKLRDTLGVSDAAISNAIARRAFPPKWFLLIKAQCDTLGIECPTVLFSFDRRSSVGEGGGS